MKNNILFTNSNCWRISKVEQLSMLIDSHNYYRAFLEVSQKARSTVQIAGWEIDGRMIINPLEPQTPISLRNYLNRLSSNVLDIHLLTWKAPGYLAFGRERFSLLKWKLNSNNKIEFTHNRFPYFFGSFHEKVAIIDHSCAFIGGIDLAKKRWDTQGHHCHEQYRKDWNGEKYNPIHDVQFVLSGEIIGDLAEFIQKRSKKNLVNTQQSRQSHNSLWPDSFPPEIKNIHVGISRTEVTHDIFEIENLYIDAIRSAERYIMIENQYFSHRKIINELCHKLGKENGPEIIIILPYFYRGNFEQSIYLQERNRAISRLKKADSFNKLRIYYPHNPTDNEKNFIVVHSKCMMIDHQFLTMGSANLNYRSMRVDREVNLSIESARDNSISQFIFNKLASLLSEHLNVSEKDFEDTLRINNSLIKSIETFQGTKNKTLRDIKIVHIPWKIKLLYFLYPIVDLKTAVSKNYAYWACGGVILFIILTSKVLNEYWTP